MTFKEFLEKGLDSGDFDGTPESDFAEDVMSDSKFRNFKKWSDLETYLVFHGACREAIKAAKNLFQKWEWRDKTREK